jgi:heptosyltransferase-1
MPDSRPLRVLLVKTSSMGDVVQALPVVQDILRHRPGSGIEWMLEPGYADLVRQHPGVERAIPVPWREWRRRPLAAQTRAQWRELRADLAARRFDAVIDLQGLCKSAILARLAPGPRYGWKGRACREPLAACLYDRRMRAPPLDTRSAVLRYRELCAWALGYAVQGEPVYGLRPTPLRPEWLPGRAPFAVLLSATARDEKLWPEDSWVDLGVQLRARGLALVLAWGSEVERARAQRIAARVLAANPDPAAAAVVVAPRRLGLLEWAQSFAAASLVVGVDTGLSFLAAAVQCPVVGVYTATSPLHVGIQASSPHRNLGEIGRAPSSAQVLQAALEMLAQGAVARAMPVALTNPVTNAAAGGCA